MLKFLQSIFSGKAGVDESPHPSPTETPPHTVSVEGVAPFPFSSHITIDNQFPYIDWPAVESWVAKLPSDEIQGLAWSACERAWLLHFRAALGPNYQLAEAEDSLLISSLEPNVARATLEFMNLTLGRIVHVLDGVAAISEWGKDILIVFDDYDGYYNYVSHYYPEQGEFATSSGMYIHSGCGHFVTVKSDLRVIEPVIVHEMTHGCVAHLPVPAWLNEGIAVNMERRLGYAGSPLYTPREMHQKHMEFWGQPEIQEFWSGKSFLRSDEGSILSYDLARIIVEQMAKDWEAFRDFILAADRADSGFAAASEHLGVGLGECVCTILEIEDSSGWEPDPNLWDSEPEKGGFSARSRKINYSSLRASFHQNRNRQRKCVSSLKKDQVMASVSVSTQIEIDRPISEVAAFAVNPDNAPLWYENIKSVEWKSEPPLQVGSEIAFVAHFLGRRLVYTYQIIEWLPSERLVMRTSEGPFPMQTTYLCRPLGPRRAHMTLRNDGAPKGFSRLVAPFMSMAMRRANQKDLARLKRVLEQRK